jgi:hypothetical protein
MDLATLNLLNSNPQGMGNEKEETKSFTFRALDPILHTAWKTCAAMANCSMEEFGAAAIRAYIKQSVDAQKKT